MLGQFNSISALWHMGGYAAYVWPAYSIVVIVLLSQFYWCRRQLKRLKQQLRQRYAQKT